MPVRFSNGPPATTAKVLSCHRAPTNNQRFLYIRDASLYSQIYPSASCGGIQAFPVVARGAPLRTRHEKRSRHPGSPARRGTPPWSWTNALGMGWGASSFPSSAHQLSPRGTSTTVVGVRFASTRGVHVHRKQGTPARSLRNSQPHGVHCGKRPVPASHG